MKTAKKLAEGADGNSPPPISRAEQAYRQIRLAILSFELRPGEVVSEGALADRFDLKIASVRAALPRLRQEGLLINQQRGQIVSPVTLQDIQQTYELRFLLEPAAAEKAVRRLDASVLRELDEQARAPTEPGDRASELQSIFANRDFHVSIAQNCGNEQLLKYIRELQDETIRFQYLLRQSEAGGIPWQHSHENIIAAFEEKSPQKAAEAMKEHIRLGRSHTLQAVMELPEFQQLPLGERSLRVV